MTFRVSRYPVFALLIAVISLATGGLTQTMAQDKDTEKARATIAGEWIRYNNGTFEIRKFKAGTEVYIHHNEYGSVNKSVTADLNLALEGGIVRFLKTNFRLTDPELAKTRGAFRNWDGSIDELGIWSRALTDAEVDGLWNKGKGSAITAPSNNSLGEELIGYWPFDGNLVEKTGTGRDGIGVKKPGFSAGKLGKALHLDGSSQYVKLGGKPSDYEPASGVISISVWCQANELDSVWQSIISKGQGNNWRIHRHWQMGSLSSAGVNVLHNPVRIDDKKFHHVVAIMESRKQATFYIDNQKVVQPTTGFLGRSPRLPTVGADLLFTNFTGGYIVINNNLRQLFTNNNNNNNLGRPFRRTSHPQEALLIAARKGDLATITKSLKAGVEADATSPNSYTALGYAAAGGHLELMNALLSKGADVNLKTRFGKTPLLVAAGTEHIKAIDLLLSKGASLDARSDHGGSSAHEAVFWQQPKVLDHLLKKGIDVNGRANNQTTPLHWAVGFMHPNNPAKNKIMRECIEVLLAHKADKTLQGNGGRTAAQVALDKGFADLAKKLK
ncbi:MAG: ankyrin repeat domain-containing protein [Pirellulaceae bacterium]|nr:ankyrin repeat domain-containing protein [Pirellulaceae bacterium]